MLKRLLDGIRQEMLINQLSKAVRQLTEELDTAKCDYEDMEDLYHHYKELTIIQARDIRRLKLELKRLSKNETKHI